MSARWIVGEGGRRKIQLRLDLGLLQMEPTGRPDGQCPHGVESALAHYEALERESGGDEGSFLLEAPACSELQQEAAQYYYRYIARYALRDLDGVVSDTDHNLAILELVARRVEDDEIAWQFLQFYPYIRMMHARARAELASERHDFDEAIRCLEEGIQDLESFADEYSDEEEPWRPREIELLTDLLGDIRSSRPRTEMDRLQDELSLAVAAENFERAAKLRDAIRALRGV